MVSILRREGYKNIFFFLKTFKILETRFREKDRNIFIIRLIIWFVGDFFHSKPVQQVEPLLSSVDGEI